MEAVALKIEDQVLAAAQEESQRTGRSLSEVISHWLHRRDEDHPQPRSLSSSSWQEKVRYFEE